MIWSIVKRFNNRNCELEDLYQLGTIGFIKAVKRFDTSFETKLSTYAVPMIIGEIKRFLRDNGPIKVSRSLKEIAMKVKEVQESNDKKGNELSIENISEILKIDKEDIVMALDANSFVDSLDRKIGEDDYTIGDKIANKQDEYEMVINDITLKKEIQALSPKEQKIITYRYYRGMTQMQVAELFETSQVQISRIEKKVLKKMHDKICI